MEVLLMSSWTEKELARFYSTAFRSKERLKKSGQLGCFYCGHIYSYHLVEEFIETENIALCPICGVDAVMPLAKIPKSKHVNLLDEMYLRYFADDDSSLREIMISHFYLYQKKEVSQQEVIDEVEEVFERTERRVKRNVYKYDKLTESYSFAIFNEVLMIYPLEDQFIKHIFPRFYQEEDISEESLRILDEIIKYGPEASFIIALPGILKKRKAEHLVKLLGMAFGGYFTRLDDLPADGVLTKEDHFYINAYENKDYDLINNLEKLLIKYD